MCSAYVKTRSKEEQSPKAAWRNREMEIIEGQLQMATLRHKSTRGSPSDLEAHFGRKLVGTAGAEKSPKLSQVAPKS